MLLYHTVSGKYFVAASCQLVVDRYEIICR